MRRWSLLPLLCGLGLLALGCTTRTTVTPGPPTSKPVPTKQPGATSGSQFVRPDVQMEVQGTLESGIPFGLAQGNHFFQGDPNAPVLLIEFSDYQ